MHAHTDRRRWKWWGINRIHTFTYKDNIPTLSRLTMHPMSSDTVGRSTISSACLATALPSMYARGTERKTANEKEGYETWRMTHTQKKLMNWDSIRSNSAIIEEIFPQSRWKVRWKDKNSGDWRNACPLRITKWCRLNSSSISSYVRRLGSSCWADAGRFCTPGGPPTTDTDTDKGERFGLVVCDLRAGLGSSSSSCIQRRPESSWWEIGVWMMVFQTSTLLRMISWSNLTFEVLAAAPAEISRRIWYSSGW